MKATLDNMKNAGVSAVKQLNFTDKEVLDNIRALELVIAYLDGRGDANLMLYPLRRDLEMFQTFKTNRGI